MFKVTFNIFTLIPIILFYFPKASSPDIDDLRWSYVTSIRYSYIDGISNRKFWCGFTGEKEWPITNVSYLFFLFPASSFLLLFFYFLSSALFVRGASLAPSCPRRLLSGERWMSFFSIYNHNPVILSNSFLRVEFFPIHLICSCILLSLSQRPK